MFHAAGIEVRVRVLVTGAGGYIAHYVVMALRLAGHVPVGLVRQGSSHCLGDIETMIGDLLDRESLDKAVRGVDAVCHLAGLRRARESWADTMRYFSVNVGGTISLMEAMDAAGVNRIVFASTAAIYGSPPHVPINEDVPDQPLNPYACSKLAAELAIEAQAMSGRLGAVVLRFLNVAGGLDLDSTRMVPRVVAAATGGGILEISGNGLIIRDYLHVEDVARAFVAALSMTTNMRSTRYNIGSGLGSSVLDIVAAVEKMTGRAIRIVYRPPEDAPQFLVCDAAKAQAELAWRPEKSDIDVIVRDAMLSRLG